MPPQTPPRRDITPIELAQAFAIVRRRSAAAGRDGVTPDDFGGDLDARLEQLSTDLAAGRWRPDALLRLNKRKPDGRRRPLAIPTVSDRVVIEVLRLRLEPRIEPILSQAAWAYRPRRSARRAVETVTRAVSNSATSWVALADIREFFDTIPLDALVGQILDLADDPLVHSALPVLLEHHALRRGRGLVQGSSLSPLLSNLYLTPFDRALLAAGWNLTRYSDNLCVVTSSERDAHAALRTVRQRLQKHGLALREANVHTARGGFRWLGFLVGSDGARVSEAALAALRDRVAECIRGLEDRHAITLRLEAVIRGWVQYYDAALPSDADLGPHTDVVRQLITKFSASEPDDTETPIAEPVEPWEPEPLIPALWPDSQSSGRAHEARAELLDLADRLATAGDFAGAEDAFTRAQQVELVASEPPANDEPTVQPFTEAMDAFLGLFCAGQTRFETAGDGSPGRRDFVETMRPPGLTEVSDHLNGRSVLAVRPRLDDGMSSLGVLDIDAVGADPDGVVSARAYTEALSSVARDHGLTALVEHTGGRGFHLWFPVEGPLPADDVAERLDRLLALAGQPPVGVRAERLPAADHEADRHAQPMTLPLGIHAETKTRSALSWVGGPSVTPELEGIFFARPSTLEDLRTLGGPPPSDALDAAGEQLLPTAIPDWTRFGASVRRVWDGCAVVRYLVRKGSLTGHLDHPERLSLLYVLGHLGEQGERALHATIGKCRNYDVKVTQQQIERRGPLPISCRRMREKHVDETLAAECNCELGDVHRRGGYATPLLHASGFRRAWRDALHGRIETRRAHREDGSGVTDVENLAEQDDEDESQAQIETAPAPQDAEPVTEDTETPAPTSEALVPRGIALGRCLPPHEWA